jgi:hypothetical protein
LFLRGEQQDTQRKPMTVVQCGAFFKHSLPNLSVQLFEVRKRRTALSGWGMLIGIIQR